MTDASETESNHRKGRFVVLDGPDGGGKSTQAALLADWLRAQGLEVVTCRDPGGTALGDRLRSLLLDRDSVPLSMRSEMLLYQASRAQLVDEIIRPALEAGKVVVSDRFLLANIVYQGFAGGLGIDVVGAVGKAATGGLVPDLTLILDVPLEVAKIRVAKARDRIEDRPESYHAKVRQGFLNAVAASEAGECSYYPGQMVKLSATSDIETLSLSIRNEVVRVLALDPRG